MEQARSLFSHDTNLTLAELRPPKGVDLGPLLGLAERLRGRVDAVVVPDNAGAVLSLCPQALARRLAAAGLEVVLGLSCRDRNRLALQSALLGAVVEGLGHVLVVRGQDPAYGDHPRALAVWDLEPQDVLAAMRRFVEGVDLAGNPLPGVPALVGGAELDPFVPPEELRAEVGEVERRVGAGASFFLTPTVHDARRFAEAIEPFRGLGVPIVARVVLLKSVGMARYLNRNVAGDKVPEATIKRLQKAPDKGEAALRIAAELAAELRELCQGVCFVPLGWEDRLPALLDLT